MKALVGLTLMVESIPGLLSAIGLPPGAVKAWDEYVRSAGLPMQARLDGRRPFSWTDESPDGRLCIRRGEILVEPVVGHGTQNVSDNAAIEGQYQAHDFAVNAGRGYSVADTKQVQEIEGYAHSGEHLLRPGEGNGFIWRLHSIARHEERDGGVYLQLEAIDLTRDIPASLRWLVHPIVKHLSIKFQHDYAPPDPRCGEFISRTAGTTRTLPESKPQLRQSEAGEG